MTKHQKGEGKECHGPFSFVSLFSENRQQFSGSAVSIDQKLSPSRHIRLGGRKQTIGT